MASHRPEPQYSITQRNRNRNSLSPFSRLAQASWIAANVSYMKDLDYLEGRIRSANTYVNAINQTAKAENGDTTQSCSLMLLLQIVS